MRLFRKRKEEPTMAMQLAYAGEMRPSTPTDYQASSNTQHLFTLDEKVLERLQVDPHLQDLIPLFGVTADTNFLDEKGVKLLSIKQQKAIKYTQLGMTRSMRRLYLPYMKSLEANAYGRVWNNHKGQKIKALTTERKQIVTGEAKKVKEL